MKRVTIPSAPTLRHFGAVLASAALAALAATSVAQEAPQPEQPVAPLPQPDPGNLRAYIELARADIRTEKTLIIAQNLDLTAEEAVEFWPLHREYNLEYNKLLDTRLALITEFLGIYDSMSDDQAKDLARKVFDLEEKRTRLKKSYFRKFCRVVPARKAARFFQIENQLNAALDLRLAAALPLIQ